MSVLLIVYTLVSVFLMFPISDFIWGRIILLQNFQFPWRFLAIIVFTSSVFASLFLDSISKKTNVKLIVLISILIIVAISSFYWKPKAYQNKPESFYTGVYESTTDTGESAPIWSVRFMEKRPKARLEVIDGNAIIRELDRKSTYHKYQVQVNKPTLFEENTLYFPGWEIKANGVPLKVEFQNMNYRGVMLFNLSKGNYIVEVVYKETKLRAISDVISFVSLLIVLCFMVIRFVKPRFS